MSEAMECIRSLDRAREAAADSLQTEAANDYHCAAIRHINEADRIMAAYHAMKAVAEMEREAEE